MLRAFLLGGHSCTVFRLCRGVPTKTATHGPRGHGPFGRGTIGRGLLGNRPFKHGPLAHGPPPRGSLGSRLFEYGPFARRLLGSGPLVRCPLACGSLGSRPFERGPFARGSLWMHRFGVRNKKPPRSLVRDGSADERNDIAVNIWVDELAALGDGSHDHGTCQGCWRRSSEVSLLLEPFVSKDTMAIHFVPYRAPSARRGSICG